MIVRPLLALLLAAAAPPAAERAGERDLMVLTVKNLAATAGIRPARSLDARVLAAMREVPRHAFVPQELRRHAYENRPLPIGHEATISQPFIVALMTDLLEPEKHHRVLEVGTGSGYQAAILSRLVREVRTIEIVAPLAERAARDLAAMGYANVTVRVGDGYAGWPEAAPFDRIIVTAGAGHIPQPLVDQLAPGGRMVIPVGRNPDSLQLTVVTRDLKGRIRKRAVLPVNFVPLVRAPAR